MKMIGLFSFLVAASAGVFAQETGEHTDWPRWCGKVYQSGYPSFNPGGQSTPPADTGSTNLHVQFKSRYSSYVDTESIGSFIVNAELSRFFGSLWENETSNGVDSKPFDTLVFSINLVSDDTPLVQNQVAVNSTDNAFDFDLSALEPSLEPIQVALYGASEYADYTYNVTAEFFYLPDNAPGSVTKIDNLNGGLLFKGPATNNTFQPFLPYGYYGTFNGSDSTAESLAQVEYYTSNGQGLNSIISLASFPDTNPIYDAMDELGLRFMFDLRGSYKNLTEVRERVNTIKHHTALFGYWTADEPDGWQDPFQDPIDAQSLIHELDPYHPVAVTLNCQDYYFDEYSLGADILMEDAYPIGINSTFSKWNTTCNTTLGDCGCDNCEGTVQDVSSRLDDLSTYEEWLGRWPLTKFHNPQVFHGEDYWFRDPSSEEAVAMNALALNHGARGIFGWTWPGSEDLFDVHSALSNTITKAPVVDFLMGGKPTKVSVDGLEIIDVAYWVEGNRILVCIVNGGYVDTEGPVTIPIGQQAAGVEAVILGGLGWDLNAGDLSISKLPGMSSSMVILTT